MSPDVAEAIERVCAGDGVDPVRVKAIVLVECAGKPFYADGRTPKRLFERARFYGAIDPSRRAQAVKLGLAWPTYRLANYADQQSRASIDALIARAAAFDESAAWKSCSYGMGQVMGDECRRCGYPDARAMYQAFTGDLDAQVRAIVAFCRSKGILDLFDAGDWAGIATLYNGPKYYVRHYDEQISQAYASLGGVVVSRPGPSIGRLALSSGPIAAGVVGEGVSAVGTVTDIAPAVTDAVQSTPDMPSVPTSLTDKASAAMDHYDTWSWRLRSVWYDAGPVVIRALAWLKAHPLFAIQAVMWLTVLLLIEILVIAPRLRHHRLNFTSQPDDGVAA